ncbi:MAG: 1-deoxy-D-xylulose-5-phosphate reductoisomerase [bacterium]|jgi:1-deoxy-D-xylulose-5-phosphate reductoisomerase
MTDQAKKRVAILGSTGSIGLNALDVASSMAGLIDVVGLTANRNIEALASQIEKFEPRMVAVGDEKAAREIAGQAESHGTEVFWGEDGLVRAARLEDADLILNAVVGGVGIAPTLAAVRAGKNVAIANKECLVAAGEIITREAMKSGSRLIPVDSEHSAVYQCLKGEKPSSVSKIVLTASGGPLVDMSVEEIEQVRAAEALRHPNWNMGRKVTIDSATLMNKGFEVIEAHWLFGVDADRIEVVVERKSLVHALVEFVDGNVVALLSEPDMRLPIQYAMTYPDRMETRVKGLDLEAMGGISFEMPDYERFPCLRLAFEAIRSGGTVPAVLSAADEVAVEAFLDGGIRFGEIFRILDEVVAGHERQEADSLEAVMKADGWARRKASELAGGASRRG